MKQQTIVKQKMGAISLIVILASVCVATSFSIYDYINESRRLKLYFNGTANPISKRLASNLQRPIWFMDKESIQKLIELEAIEKSIYAVVVRESEDQTVLFARKREIKTGISLNVTEKFPVILLLKLRILYTRENLSRHR